MATINQFSPYSQKENAVTNNVLLMFSNLYRIDPKYYEDFIQGITEDAGQYEVIPVFSQQVGNKGCGVIDGFIQVKASKIIIETKIERLEGKEKLLKYTKSFEEGEHKLLFHLSSKKYPEKDEKEIVDKLKENKIKNIYFKSFTYEDLVEQLKGLAKEYQYEQQLQILSDDFESYCIGQNLINSKHILRAMACGQSFELNVKHEFYFDRASRGYSDFNYLGIYKKKSVRYIARVENWIDASWNEKDGLEIKEQFKKVTEEQKVKLIEAIKDTIADGWDVRDDRRFFLLKDFTETDFKKTSPGGIFRVRFFNLEDYMQDVPKKIEEIAEELKTMKWEDA